MLGIEELGSLKQTLKGGSPKQSLELGTPGLNQMVENVELRSSKINQSSSKI